MSLSRDYRDIRLHITLNHKFLISRLTASPEKNLNLFELINKDDQQGFAFTKINKYLNVTEAFNTNFMNPNNSADNWNSMKSNPNNLS